MTTIARVNVPSIRTEITYLEMNADPQCEPADLGYFLMRQPGTLEVETYLDVYRAIGRDYLWNYRPGQTEEEISAIINSPTTWMYFLYSEAEVVGIAELDASNPKSIELVHFGLLPRLLHRGLGRSFLQNVLHAVWARGIERIWLSTCSLDHPKAIRFYEASGFRRLRSEYREMSDWRFTGFYDMDDAPHIAFGELSKDLSILTMRPSTQDDEDFVNQLTRSTMKIYVDATWPDQESREKYYQSNRFVSENTRIICAGVGAIGRLSIKYRESDLFIDNMHVIPKMQGRGVGAWVLEKVISEGKQQGRKILVTVLKTNPAKRLYERAGFEVYGEANGRYQMRCS